MKNIFLSAAIFCAAANANLPLRDYWGETVRWHDARSLAWAGVHGLEPGPAGLFGNPAALGFTQKPRVSLTYALRISQEERTRILYDQFENTLAEVAIADNIHSNNIPGPVCGLLPWQKLTLAAGIAPVLDFNYYYLKEFRDEFYVQTGEDRVEQSGMVHEARFALGSRLLNWLAIGAAGGYQFGRRRLLATTVRGQDTSTLFDEAGAPQGFRFGAGLVVLPIQNLALGLDFNSGTKLVGWSTSDTSFPARSDTRQYPWSGRLAVRYQAPGVLPSILSAEARYDAWSGADSGAKNTVLLQAGVEHLMLNFVRLRYGFGVEPSPFDPTVHTGRFGFGVGFDVGNLQIDLGGLISRDVIGPSLFSSPLSPDDIKVYETRNTIAVTLSRDF